VAQEARANVTLKTGKVSETVEVQANAVTLDTDSSAISQTVTERQVDELPLNGRNFLNLLFISAGAVQTVGEIGQMRQGEGNAISINGGRPESNNYTLDGLANTDPALTTPAVILSQDAIQEFKILSENYSASYGFSANQVDIVSKSGTNQIHGTAFEFARNDDFDAYTPTPFQATPSKPALHQNQFGFVVGGPVYIPKLYDGRNKTFWLANYEGWRIVNGYVVNGIVPPIRVAAMPSTLMCGNGSQSRNQTATAAKATNTTRTISDHSNAWSCSECSEISGWVISRESESLGRVTGSFPSSAGHSYNVSFLGVRAAHFK
jgi:hypothetical protein